mgnify:CR=1 FL=1
MGSTVMGSTVMGEVIGEGYGSKVMGARLWEQGYGSTVMGARLWEHGYGSTVIGEVMGKSYRKHILNPGQTVAPN